VTVWIPGRIKELAVKLAFQQHHELSVVVAEALQAYALAKGAKPSTLIDMRRIEALIDQKIAQALASQPPTLPPPEAPKPTPPAGKKVCSKGHVPYPATKKECPHCVRLRQRVAKQRKAEARRGGIPT
jgi:hypothetical protein